jgi:hypothetical protein
LLDTGFHILINRSKEFFTISRVEMEQVFDAFLQLHVNGDLARRGNDHPENFNFSPDRS